jgi:hypothetical protein
MVSIRSVRAVHRVGHARLVVIRDGAIGISASEIHQELDVPVAAGDR